MKRGRRAGFSVPELLAVVAIVVILISLLMPTMQLIREQGRRVQCSSSLHQLMLGVTTYAAEHQNRMPAFYHPWYSNVGMPYDDWLMGRDPNVLTCVGKGSIFPYANKSELYRCPSLKQGVFTSGKGSNGGFDYALFIAFAGTLKHKIPSSAEFTLASGQKVTLPVPILCEEEPAQHINSSSPEPGHCAGDSQGTWHGGGSFYVSLDASVHYFLPEGTWTSASNWAARKPDGGFISLGNWWGVNNYDSWGKH